MSRDPRFNAIIHDGANRDVVAVIERLVADGRDEDLYRIDPIDFAAEHGLAADKCLDAFLHAAKVGLFDMAWNLGCPGCGGILDETASLKSIRRERYSCALCYNAYEPSLDDLVEVSFNVSQALRKIAAHEPDRLPIADYYRQIYFSRRFKLGWQELSRALIGSEELAAGAKIILSAQVPPGQGMLLFDPVLHSCSYFKVAGEPTRDRQEVHVVYMPAGADPAEVVVRPGPLRLVVENRSPRRTLPSLYRIGAELHDALSHRKEFLTGKQVLTNQTFRDLYRTDAMDFDQRLKITSLTVLFTDLKGSTELYERVGDLQAYDLVRGHFTVLTDAVRVQGGSVVKTIGDAVMATFPTPARGTAAALAMRNAMAAFNAAQKHDALIVKIGLHEGPCLAVMLNERLDYFGQTVNIAARVQGLATSQSIFATEPVIRNDEVGKLLAGEGLVPTPQRATLRGIKDELTVYEIP